MDANKPIEMGICEGCSSKIENEARNDPDGKKHERHQGMTENFKTLYGGRPKP
jgi:uncharacterized protein YlaI